MITYRTNQESIDKGILLQLASNDDNNIWQHPKSKYYEIYDDNDKFSLVIKDNRIKGYCLKECKK